jgi:hypothetical protein
MTNERPRPVDGQGNPIKAIGMVSGGLDSTIATMLMAGMGIQVYGVNFSTGFCLTDHHRAMAKFEPETADIRRLRNEALRAGVDAQVPVQIVDIAEEYLTEVVLEPKHGRGKGMNPCIDCRIFMLVKARALMEEIGAHFVFTGEVLGQRPMSQHMQTLRLIEEQAGLKELLLRPLSARHMEPTIPEQEGWVDREQLLDIQGRGRKVQMGLAEDYGIHDYPQPAGGCCFLPDLSFSERLQDAFIHIEDRTRLTREDMLLLKVGRHFRLPSGVKVIVARDSGENAFIQGLSGGRWALQVIDHGSPITLVDADAADEDLQRAAELTARYSQGREEERVRVRLTLGETEREIEVIPADPATTNPMMV